MGASTLPGTRSTPVFERHNIVNCEMWVMVMGRGSFSTASTEGHSVLRQRNDCNDIS